MPTGGGCSCPQSAPGAVTEVSLAGCSFSVAADGIITARLGVDVETFKPFTGEWGSFLVGAGFCPAAVLAAVVNDA